MMNVINKSLNYNAKTNYINKKNLWDKMLNLDHSPKGSLLAFFFGAAYGWVCHLFLLDVSTFTWEFLIKGTSGIVFAVITAFSVKIANDFYAIKIKHKIFKDGKSNKTKTDKADQAKGAA
jgi:hypothetical protein